MFPGDTAVSGVLDLGGNVVEWCQTRRRDEKGKDYPLPYRHDDDREDLDGDNSVFRETRGGVWLSEKKWSRCSTRVDFFPFAGLDTNGFRLVLSPFFDSGL